MLWIVVLAAVSVLASAASLGGQGQQAAPKAVPDPYRTANAFLGKGEYDNAIAAYSEAIRLDPKGQEKGTSLILEGSEGLVWRIGEEKA